MTILPDLVLTSRADQCWQYSGIDSLEECLDKEFFLKYPHEISYQYNSRGFRDAEWPKTLTELANAIWCVGDSFTVGLGSPVEHTWPNVLQQRTKQRTINVSMDGASNQWIARQAVNILQAAQPRFLVVQWSYLHRREDPNTSLCDEDRRLFAERLDFDKDLENLLSCISSIEQNKNNCQVIYSIIPGTGLSFNWAKTWEQIKDLSWPSTAPRQADDVPTWISDELKTLHNLDLNAAIKLDEMIKVKQYDRARDSHHYGLKTSHWFCQQIIDCSSQLNANDSVLPVQQPLVD